MHISLFASNWRCVIIQLKYDPGLDVNTRLRGYLKVPNLPTGSLPAEKSIKVLGRTMMVKSRKVGCRWARQELALTADSFSLPGTWIRLFFCPPDSFLVFLVLLCSAALLVYAAALVQSRGAISISTANPLSLTKSCVSSTWLCLEVSPMRLARGLVAHLSLSWRGWEVGAHRYAGCCTSGT